MATKIDGTGYVVSPLDGVNQVSRKRRWLPEFTWIPSRVVGLLQNPEAGIGGRSQAMANADCGTFASRFYDDCFGSN
jgi:hypothetical protein